MAIDNEGNGMARIYHARMVAKLLFVLGSRAGVTLLSTEATPYRYGHGSYPPGNRHYRQRQQQRHRGPPKRMRSFGSSPPDFDIMEGDDEPSISFFERNGINPPPLIPRRRRVQAETVENEQPPSELVSIIDDAKRGEDDNARLRYDLIWRPFYDKHSYPWEYAWYNETDKRMGVPVEMNINFHRVFSVDIVNSVMDLVVWFRLVWVDPRLTWEPEEYGGLNKTWFWIGDGGAGGEMSEIWTPDFELWNMDEGLKDSLEDSYARVSYDGTVWWGRPGHLRPTCKFIGLETFPFDRLTCTMEFGSWMLSGKYLRIEKHNGAGFTIGGSETAGESYTEYRFPKKDPVICEKHVYQFRDDDWPVLFYNVTVARSWQPYARGYFATQVMLNFVGFSAFWLPPSCGERMTLSITSMVAALYSEIVIVSKMPAAAELTWFAKFHILSMFFAFISLLESVLVLYFYYKRCEDLVPEWYSFAKNWYLVRQARKHGTQIVAKTTEFVTETTNHAVDALQNTTESLATCVKDAVRRSSADDTNDQYTNDQWDHYDDKTLRLGDATVSNRSPKDSSLPTATFPVPPSMKRESSNTRYSTAFTVTSTLAQDADDFHNEQEVENNMKWKIVAARIDDIARFWIPLAFVISLSIILAEVF